MIDWKIDSWRQFPIKQVPEYSDKSSVEKVEKELSIRPPLVFAEEARRLRKRMADVAEGKAFLLQGGDCAESFAEHNANNIKRQHGQAYESKGQMGWPRNPRGFD